MATPRTSPIASRHHGVLVSLEQGKAVAYALLNLEDRGQLMIPAGAEVYGGMIIGENAKPGDLDVNPLKAKQLTNFRAAGKDDAVTLTTPLAMTLEKAISYIGDDELVEVTRKPSACASAISTSMSASATPNGRRRSDVQGTFEGGPAMTITIYHNPRCSKSRQTLALLQDRGVTPRVVEYLKTPPDAATLGDTLAKLGCPPRQLMRVKEAVYRELGLGDENLSDADLIQAMVDNPILIERPIVLAGDRAALGRPPEAVLIL